MLKLEINTSRASQLCSEQLCKNKNLLGAVCKYGFLPSYSNLFLIKNLHRLLDLYGFWPKLPRWER